MNRVSLSLLKSLVVATVAVTGLACAADAQKAAVKVEPAKGASLYDSGDAARGLPACVSCHGPGGNSTIATNPKLAGQVEAYVHKQLVDFTTPSRNQPIMTTYAKALTDEEKKNIAAYLATQAPQQGAARNKETVELGRKIYRGGIADKGVPACASCHGATASGIPVKYPRLAGQHQDYTLAQFEAFKSGARGNSAEMTAVSKRMSPEEMKAVADYIAGIK
jgi:cytochrome c553